MSRLLTLAGDDILTIPLRPALELTPIAVAIVTNSGKLLECNGEFSRMLNAADSIRLTGGDIQAVDETDRAALRGAIGLMAAPASGTGRRILRLSRAGGETSLAVIVSKAPHALQKSAGGSGQNLACLAIVDPGRQSTPAPEVLMELFGLTQAEARVALQIGAGKSINEIAGGFRRQGRHHPVSGDLHLREDRPQPADRMWRCSSGILATCRGFQAALKDRSGYGSTPLCKCNIGRECSKIPPVS